MRAFQTIPEPTTGYRSIDHEAPAEHAPLPLRPGMESAVGKSADHEEADSVASWLMVIVGSAVFLRIATLYFGAFRGIDSANTAAWIGLGERIFESPGSATTPWPIFPIGAAISSQIGLPAWFAVIIGTLLSLAAIPASYVVGKHVTGSVKAGLGLAALIGLHPAMLMATDSFGPIAMSLGLVTLSLALISLANKHSYASMLPGAGLLGLAALSAPIAWAAIPLGVLLAADTKSIYTMLARGGAVLALAVAPAVGWFAFSSQHPLVWARHGASWPIAHWAISSEAAAESTTQQRLSRAAVGHSLEELGQSLHAPIHGRGPLTMALLPVPSTTTAMAEDPVANVVGDLWIGLNLVLLLMAAGGAVVMVLRRRIAFVIALALPLAVLLFTSPLLGEAGRVTVLVLQGGLAMGLFASPAMPKLTEQERAERDAKRLAKQQAKKQAKLDKAEKAAATDLHSFDKPGRRRKRDRRDQRDRRERRSKPTAAAEDRPQSAGESDQASEPMGRPL